MKRLLSLLAPVLITAASAQSTSRLASEWHVPLRTSSKTFALVDASSGIVRIATMDSGGSLGWSTPVPTGLANISDATAGLPGTSGEILALASVSSNRVILLDILSAAPFPRVMTTLSGIGPSGVAPIGPGPNHELLVATRANGTAAGRLETHHDLSASAAIVANSSHTTPFRRLQPLTQPGGTATVALATGTSGVNTRVELAGRSGASHSLVFKATFTNTVEFSTNIHSEDNPTRLFTIGYRAGTTLAQLVEFTTPLNLASSYTNHPLVLPFAISTVIPVHDGGVGGNMKDGFLAIAANGTQAAHIRINAAGTGITPPVQTFTAEPGTFLNGLIPVPGIGIVKLGSSTAGGPSELYHAYQWDGSAWVQTDAGMLPALPASGEMPATLLFYNKDPLLEESARLIGVRHLAAWTRRTSPLPVPTDVLAETFASSSAGLTSSGNQPVLAPHGTNYVLTNQFESGISIAAAGDLGALMAPSLRVGPPSGTYHESFQITAEYDAVRHSLLVRKDGGNWSTAADNLAVAWSTTLEFTLKSAIDGSHGPIHTRTYTLPAASLADVDSDNDGVPDYVELHLGLDPFGGADSDGDGVSDLDEILQGTDPADSSDFPDPNLTAGVSPEGGISLVATATAAGGAEIAIAQDLVAHGLDGSLIARAPVAGLANPLPDGGTRGAILQSSAPQPLGGLVAVSSPIYFDVIGGVRTGREVIAFFPATPPPPFEPSFTPSGTNLASNAAGWIAAAQAAAANRPVALARSTAEPADAAVAVLLEEMIHAALAAVRHDSDPPMALGDFSFLPGRAADLRREYLTPADRALLAAEGFDFGAALALAKNARAGMSAAAQAIYQRHVNTSASTPGMPLPIDALRSILRDEPAPTGYVLAVTPGTRAMARFAYTNALSNLTQAFRPSADWNLEVLATPPTPGVYLRTTDAIQVVLLNADGSRFRLERGLGLQPGTRFTVTGFTDTPPAGSFPTMEITAAVFESSPTASDNDQDGNLLDDEWEKFFFGETGQDPYSQPHGGGFFLLQYFLDGIDPRGGDLPMGVPVDLTPQLPILTPIDGGGYTLDFLFPEAYQNQVNFTLERSTTLAPDSWMTVPGIVHEKIGDDELRFTIPPGEAPPGSAFYRVGLALD